jgi:hypothetical protein
MACLPLTCWMKSCRSSRPDNRQRYAIISTCLDTYNNVPDRATLTEVGKRCEVRSALDIPEGKFYFDVEFES